MNCTADLAAPLAGFEPLLQAPARLQIIAVLAQAQEAEFARLRDITATSDSVMSKHLSALADAGAIKVRKASTSGRQKTWVSITRDGRRMFDSHVAALQRIIAQS